LQSPVMIFYTCQSAPFVVTWRSHASLEHMFMYLGQKYANDLYCLPTMYNVTLMVFHTA
jgi:hypothetical protein